MHITIINDIDFVATLSRRNINLIRVHSGELQRDSGPIQVMILQLPSHPNS